MYVRILTILAEASVLKDGTFHDALWNVRNDFGYYQIICENDEKG